MEPELGTFGTVDGCGVEARVVETGAVGSDGVTATGLDGKTDVDGPDDVGIWVLLGVEGRLGIETGALGMGVAGEELGGAEAGITSPSVISIAVSLVCS